MPYETTHFLHIEVEEDEEKTHETAGIGVIKVVPLYYTVKLNIYTTDQIYIFIIMWIDTN